MKTYFKLKTMEGKDYLFPKVMYHHLKFCKERAENKLDAIVIITGSVGSGKSNHGFGLGGTWEEHFFERPYSLSNVHFTGESIKRETDREDNFTHAINYDEAIQGGSSRDGISKIGNQVRKMLITKRFKRHLIIVCVDNLKELSDKIIERATVWYHVSYRRRKGGKYDKGRFKFFSAKQASKVYEDLKMKRYFKAEEHPIYKANYKWYDCPDFTNLWFNEKDYDKKKSKETSLIEEKGDRHLVQRDKLVHYMLTVHKMKQQEIANILGVSRTTIGDIKSKMTTGVKL